MRSHLRSIASNISVISTLERCGDEERLSWAHGGARGRRNWSDGRRTPGPGDHLLPYQRPLHRWMWHAAIWRCDTDTERHDCRHHREAVWDESVHKVGVW